MKRITLTVIALLGFQAASIAQETETTSGISEASTSDKEKKTWYVSLGAATFGDFKINDKLAAAGMPQLGDAALEGTFGLNVMLDDIISLDIELNSTYMDKKTSTNRVKAINTAVKTRVHYIPFKTDKMFFSGGLDLSYMVNNFNLYSRGNSIDLNDLEPSTHTGHISLYNNQFYVGPSVALGVFQKSEWPLRLNVGYEWAVFSSSWKSEFAKVDNSFKESGQGRFYAKLSLLFN